ncbi:5254_t:CDS:2, partial [Gigaspora rosea]
MGVPSSTHIHTHYKSRNKVQGYNFSQLSLTKKSKKEQRQGRITKTFIINQIDNFINDISNQKRKASKENNHIYDHEIQLFEDLKKIFEFTNVDNTLVFAFYRNFQEIDELNEEIATLNDQYLNETKRLEEELSISRNTSKALSNERSEIAIKVIFNIKKEPYKLEEQYKEDLNSRDFAEFELKNQIVVLKQRVIDLETSLRKISERRLNQSMGQIMKHLNMLKAMAAQ